MSALLAASLVASAMVGVACGAPDPSVSMGGHGIDSPGAPAASSSSPSAPSPSGGGSSSLPPVLGISDGGAEADASSLSAVDDLATVATIANKQYLGPDFVQVTRVPYDSAATAGVQVSEWVNVASAAAYARISPGVTGSDVVAPAGTMIVRAVLGADGSVAKLTVMFKGPLGYNPALGDWWFAVTDPNGVPAEADGGAMMGRLTQCYACHVPRVNDGFLFGAPTDDRLGYVADGGT